MNCELYLSVFDRFSVDWRKLYENNSVDTIEAFDEFSLINDKNGLVRKRFSVDATEPSTCV